MLFQYGRILNYQRCQVIPLSTTQAFACDCQKSSPEAAANDKQHNAENSAYKFRPDEVFMAFILPSPGHPVNLLLSGSPHGTPEIIAGCTGSIFQPPRG